MSSMTGEVVLGLCSVVTAGVISVLPSDPETLETLGRWPVTIALIALAAWSVWLMYRQADRSRESLDRISNKIGELCQRLAERPCIRNPKND